MLKNALIFAIAALTIAFAAPSLLVGLGGRAAPGAPSAAVVAPAPAALATVAAAEPAPTYRATSIAADAGGQYRARALIEGQGVDVMIDTGATVVALTSETAARLGVALDPSRPRWRMNTANGVALASPVTLRSVSLGAIYMNDVQAVVMPPGASSVNLLGASFLKRLVSVEQRDGTLVLRQ
ncbi:MAG: TIGR02281 family clan AA aspartic protease [Roseiarcus sp.]|jgi:aspartyl protease family protein|uniref:retropepsin-like aspartic protease family protein n=1 Tax=Roseiarcus sp. TaxID=1969460 RepID=UPI003C161BFE